tara:strand:+ start:4432 stop:5004 length:573 start_codon:yes stop_codon:yes gene_type:complete
MASFNFQNDTLGAQDATAEIGGMDEGGRGINDGNLAGLDTALTSGQEPVVQHQNSLNSPVPKITGDQMSMWGKFKAGLKEKTGGEGSMTAGQTLALGAASTALQTAAAVGEINRDHAIKMAAMQDDFDRAYGDMEYEEMRFGVAQEAQNVDRMIQEMNNIKAQNQGVASQTLQNQSQQFTRDPSSGGLLT